MELVLRSQMPYVASGKLSGTPFVAVVIYLKILLSTLCKTQFLSIKFINYKASDISKMTVTGGIFIGWDEQWGVQNSSDITLSDTHIGFKNVHTTHLFNAGLTPKMVCMCIACACVCICVVKVKQSSEDICIHTSGWVSQLPTHNVGTAVVPVSWAAHTTPPPFHTHLHPPLSGLQTSSKTDIATGTVVG